MEMNIRFGNMMPPEEAKQRPYLIDREPFHIAGNLYYVGNMWCASHLIDTGSGLILLDVPAASGLPGLYYNINKLGFRIDDVKYIIVSHAHTDHYGCVNAIVHRTHAKTFISGADAQDMRGKPELMKKLNEGLGPYNECFEPDVELKDGDIIELGNTKIRCVLTPGHTVGVMSHFWTMEADGRTVNVGIFGGAGYGSLAADRLRKSGLPLSIQQTFFDSIDKVWDEKVDLMLGNHPFHSDEYQKHMRQLKGEKEPFIDPSEWHRFLTELREGCRAFIVHTDENLNPPFTGSRLMEYYEGVFD